MEIGKIIKRMDMGSTILWLELSIKDIGRKIKDMGKGRRVGVTGQDLRVYMNLIKKMGLVNFISPMGITMWASLSPARRRARE